jgi:hypothetical protein
VLLAGQVQEAIGLVQRGVRSQLRIGKLAEKAAKKIQCFLVATRQISLLGNAIAILFTGGERPHLGFYRSRGRLSVSRLSSRPFGSRPFDSRPFDGIPMPVGRALSSMVPLAVYGFFNRRFALWRDGNQELFAGIDQVRVLDFVKQEHLGEIAPHSDVLSRQVRQRVPALDRHASDQNPLIGRRGKLVSGGGFGGKEQKIFTPGGGGRKESREQTGKRQKPSVFHISTCSQVGPDSLTDS